jgi:saccharopine dehydrogenase-like NADP-dependent oxidoreductase
MKRIIVFGAGKSATCLIDYLVKTCTQKNWILTICDVNADSLRNKHAGNTAVNLIRINVENAEERRPLIKQADLVISLLPPRLHILLAYDCVTNIKTLLTASYVDDEIRSLGASLTEKKILFLCEMGLDPGIDHMSAMQIVHRIKSSGGLISVFRSHTGGLVAPESDDNPWHYKISWNPVNVVRAGSSGALFLEKGELKKLAYQDIFGHTGLVEIKPLGKFAWYPNRDSLGYIPIYGLESAHSFIRTTLRAPGFCEGWKNIVRAGLTNDEHVVPSSIKTIAQWSKPLLPFTNVANKSLYDQLGLFEDRPLPPGAETSAKILQFQLESKWKMKETDKDMIVMLHEFEYELNGRNYFLNSSLIVKGEDSVRTAMAKTVGLPLGIAAKLIPENKMPLTGLHIPILPEIYEPVLNELIKEGIQFNEEIN